MYNFCLGQFLFFIPVIFGVLICPFGSLDFASVGCKMGQLENENKHHELSSAKPILKLTRDQISRHKSTESQRILSTHLYEVIRILWVPLIHRRNFSFVLYNSKYRDVKTRQCRSRPVKFVSSVLQSDWISRFTLLSSQQFR